jgi:hypothetical protein
VKVPSRRPETHQTRGNGQTNALTAAQLGQIPEDNPDHQEFDEDDAMAPTQGDRSISNGICLHRAGAAQGYQGGRQVCELAYYYQPDETTVER